MRPPSSQPPACLLISKETLSSSTVPRQPSWENVYLWVGTSATISEPPNNRIINWVHDTEMPRKNSLYNWRISTLRVGHTGSSCARLSVNERRTGFQLKISLENGELYRGQNRGNDQKKKKKEKKYLQTNKSNSNFFFLLLQSKSTLTKTQDPRNYINNEEWRTMKDKKTGSSYL